jgi:hypothetical protein
MKKLVVTLIALAALVAFPVLAGEYHSGATNFCYDCHTMHFSMQHGWTGGAVGVTPVAGGDWLGAVGPNEYLLKAPVNSICLDCHNGQTFAPDVLEADTNAASSAALGGRSAGALNEAGAAPYQTWKGHTLGSTTVPPGFNPTNAGFAATVYTAATGLECISCHTQHGRATAYRNLGPRYNAASVAFNVSYEKAAVQTGTADVTINVPGYTTAGTNAAAVFAPFYANANTMYSRTDGTYGNLDTSNSLDTHCSVCHGDFHGGTTDTNIDPDSLVAGAFVRHPTSAVQIGAIGGGHSSLTRFQAATARVKVYDDDYTTMAAPAPGCISCHKAHGNQNPFGLVFNNRADAAATVTEQGSATGASMPALCGQCHVQGL